MTGFGEELPYLAEASTAQTRTIPSVPDDRQMSPFIADAVEKLVGRSTSG